MDDYAKFIDRKSQLDAGSGFDPIRLPGFLFDFQLCLVEWACRMGRAAIFADCGMGKTPMQLVWADNVVRKTGKPVLIMAPLSVSQQTVEEANKFDIEATRCMTGIVGGAQTYVTNYERLHHFDPSHFGGVVCDESSIIKNFDGARKSAITEFMKKIRYRLLCTATAAPNDYIELGTSSEALGYLGFMDMLGTFFKNDEDSLHPAFIGSKWRFKRHAEQRFWRWMASWARACRKPSDLGFDDRNFVLPKLIEREHVVRSAPLDGFLFDLPAITLAEQQAETRETVKPRCELAAELLSKSKCGIAWAHLNAEADLLERLIPGAVQVKGGDSDDRKEEVFLAFRRGQIRKLVTKPKIASLGMNWQHCSHMSWFTNHSYEQKYQAIRRCWRYGQVNQVTVDNIGTTSQAGVSVNVRNKSHAADRMFEEMIRHMGDAIGIARRSDYGEPVELAPWL